jgi:hypothetical protein
MERARVKNLLESKRFYLERLKQLFKESSICVDNSQIKLLLAKNKMVSRILGDINTIDNELAQMGMDPFGEKAGHEFQALRDAIKVLAGENRMSLEDSESRLKKMRDELKSELVSLVPNRQIGAYRPFAGRRPVYYDRVN